jgi:glycosyltransferase domain-containing protein
MKSLLTIVMPLKGRHLFTFRFLWHANRMRLPYHFLIADGQVNEAVARRLDDSRKLFPELDIEYIRYPDDVGYTRYFTKMCDAMQRVRTPYVMHADNDDFLGFNGIERTLDFLETNKDYVCARGNALTFSVYSGLGSSDGGISGKFNQFYLHRDFEDLAAPLAAERLRQGGLCHAMYYAVYRTEALATIWREVSEIDFSDLTLHENFVGMRTATLGKAHMSKETITYYSQAGTGISYQPLRDWARHLLRSRFTSDAHAMITRISSTAAEVDGSDAGTIAEEVTAILEAYYRGLFSNNYASLAQFKRAMRKKWPRLVNYLRTRPRFSARREREAILSELANAGATEKGIQVIRGELQQIENALSPKAFGDFAGSFLPMARAADSRDWLYITDPGSYPEIN